MKYKKITDVKEPVSRIVFGTAIAPMMRRENMFELLDAVFSAGINTFDSARCYGQAEQSLGDWMEARGNRDKIVILTKGAAPAEGTNESRVTPEAIRADVDESLRRLKTDFIDIYMLHRDNPKVPAGPFVEVLNELREEGKIGIFGGSNWSSKRIDAANEYAYSHDMFGFEVSSPGYSLAEQVQDPWGGGCISISGEKHRREREWYLKEGIEIFAYSGLAHGFFSGKFKSGDSRRASEILDSAAIRGYCCPENLERLRRAEQLAAARNATVPQIALAWVLQQPLQPLVICSASTAGRMLSNVQALEIKLTEKELRWLSEG